LSGYDYRFGYCFQENVLESDGFITAGLLLRLIAACFFRKDLGTIIILHPKVHIRQLVMLCRMSSNTRVAITE
jgi:hypothetical protein